MASKVGVDGFSTATMQQKVKTFNQYKVCGGKWIKRPLLQQFSFRLF